MDAVREAMNEVEVVKEDLHNRQKWRNAFSVGTPDLRDEAKSEI